MKSPSFLNHWVTRLETIGSGVVGMFDALPKIPAGTTMSYAGLAAKLGAPNAMRAVGHANGSNPISVVVPCHRVIGSDGSLTGYGGGIERKRWLLRHEGAAFRDGVARAA